jgi:hypothetical protein
MSTESQFVVYQQILSRTLTPCPPEASQSLHADSLVTRLEFLPENALQGNQVHSQPRGWCQNLFER